MKCIKCDTNSKEEIFYCENCVNKIFQDGKEEGRNEMEQELSKQFEEE